MNRNTYTLEERFLTWLIQEPVDQGELLEAVGDRTEPDRIVSVRSHAQQSQAQNPLETAACDPLDAEDFAGESWTLGFGNVHRTWASIPRSLGHEPLKLGAKLVVQERFYNLLKQRLQREAEANPVLFPWESEVMEYEDGPVLGWESIAAWQPQLRLLRLPVALPEAVLAQLLEKCQAVVQSTAQGGRRLVEVVESLFPEQGSVLNDLAGSVLLGYSRDGDSLAARLLGNHVPEAYETASQEQQMTLAMIAAYEMISRLTLNLSSQEPSVTQVWETSVGRLNLRAAHEGNSLRLEAQLPAAGTVELKGVATHTCAQRDGAGVATLLVADAHPGQAYQVQVMLKETEAPLGFTIQL